MRSYARCVVDGETYNYIIALEQELEEANFWFDESQNSHAALESSLYYMECEMEFYRKLYRDQRAYAKQLEQALAIANENCVMASEREFGRNQNVTD